MQSTYCSAQLFISVASSDIQPSPRGHQIIQSESQQQLVHITQSGKVVVTCGRDGFINLLSPKTPEKLLLPKNPFHTLDQRPFHVSSCMFSPDVKFIAAGTAEGVVRVWNSKDFLTPYFTLKSHIGEVTSLCWLKKHSLNQPDILVSASSKGSIHLENISTKNLVTTYNLSSRESINTIKLSDQLEATKLVACTSQGSIVGWDLIAPFRAAEPTYTYHNKTKSPFNDISVSPISPMLIVAASLDKELTFFDINIKKVIKVISVEEPLTAVSFCPNGEELLVGGLYGGLYIYHLRGATNTYVEKYFGHDTKVTRIEVCKENSQERPKQSTAKEPESKTRGTTQIQTQRPLLSQSGVAQQLPNSSQVQSQPMTQRVPTTQSRIIQEQKPIGPSAVVASNVVKQTIQTDNVALSKVVPKPITEPQPNSQGMSWIKAVESNVKAQPVQTVDPTKVPIPPRQPLPQTVRGGQSLSPPAVKIGHLTSMSAETYSPIQMQGLIAATEAKLRAQVTSQVERVHMELLRQFEVQRLEIAQILKDFAGQRDKREAYIRQLQEENNRLKKISY